MTAATLPTTPAVVIGRLYGTDRMQELSRENGAYVMRTFYVDPDSERTITASKASEWVDEMRTYGGAVYRDVAVTP